GGGGQPRGVPRGHAAPQLERRGRRDAAPGDQRARARARRARGAAGLVSIWTELSRRPFTLSFADAGRVSTRTPPAGSGPAVVLLHGTSSHLEVFSRNVAAYADAGFAVHAIDMLSHGYTAKAMRDHEVPDYVAHLVDYLSAVGVSQVHLVGESLGGW